jgi:hypothetical protein
LVKAATGKDQVQKCTFQDLLREVVVDEGGLQSEIPGRVEAVDLILWRLGSCLAHCQQIWKEGKVGLRFDWTLKLRNFK